MIDATLPPLDILAKVKYLVEKQRYNHHLMNIPTAWLQSKGELVTVGVLDTGRPRHKEVRINKSWTAFNDYEEDKHGHSTHVCGILGAHDGNGGVWGIAPRCDINTYAVLNADGKGSTYNIVRGIAQAVEDGCQIINMSLGMTDVMPVALLEDACREAFDAGVIIIAAAGNESGAISQPAKYTNVIAVAAVNVKKERAEFSNYGPELDFCTGGVDIYSTWLDNGYAMLSGTSMASPALTGVCALILGEHLKRENRGEAVGTPIKSMTDMYEHLQRIAYDVGPVGTDIYFGNGMPVFIAPDEGAPARDWDAMTEKEMMLADIRAIEERLHTLRLRVEDE